MEKNDYLFNTIRICIKANKYCFGETLIYDIRSHQVKLVIVASDAGDSSCKKVIDKCKYYKVPYYVMFEKKDLSLLFNKNISSFGIKDENLAKKFVMNMNKGGN